MFYTSFPLNGAWEMNYQAEKYEAQESPFLNMHIKEDATGTESEDISNNIIENAIPGYWEDMSEKFKYTSFFHKLRINPEYGIQSYPIVGRIPDMALPNIMGNFFYRRNFICKGIKRASVVHFGGVQNCVSVWINDVYIGTHEGYSTPFDVEIPQGVLKDGENEIVLSVSNYSLEGYAGEPVSGLTTRAANEYTGGVTDSVEIRVYNTTLRDAAVLISKDLKKAQVRIEEKKTALSWEVCDGSRLIKKGEATGDFSFDTEGLNYWSPENPKLYTLKIKCADSELMLNFGVRSLVADGVSFKLNNTAYYLRGICEHCYFPETIHPHHDLTYYRNIIKTVKALGFNFIRFHTHIPTQEYMQAADELGILLHVECPNNTTFNEWCEIVMFCRKHPSVVIYCCGNELLIDEPFIEYLSECASYVHENTDALFSPVSAFKGIEYFGEENGIDEKLKVYRLNIIRRG